ncbi:hypothetical protein [Nocardia sp. bgisy134]
MIRRECLTAGDIDEVARIVEASGALDVTRVLPRDLAALAADALATLP